MKQTILRYSLGSNLIIYSIRVLIGFLLGFVIYKEFPEFPTVWTMISIFLVISPDEKDSEQLAIDRTKSNFIGSAIGLICYTLKASEFWMMFIGIFSAIIICKLLNILAVARTAMVAIVIVLVHEQEIHTYMGALERFISVTLGCFIGLIITLSTRRLIYNLRVKVGLIKPSELGE
ncbi:FUSC family protein [Sphingobacteriaceae bacterium WQ 2009]|uniref:FUSC family protein n=1 Tax=Rhinopithecimicrobium faecis TaxID=2820698 RepID=A0A8T4HGA6_9SPHI|nr:FUSC family protein [Sphingobacteriaceae bacterium WQ 2009]